MTDRVVPAPSFPRGFRVAALAIGLVVLAAGCGTAPDGTETAEVEGTAWRFSGPTLGTRYVVKVVAAELGESAQQTVQQIIEDELEAVDTAMSTYREDSELSRFNRHGANEPMTVSAATFGVVEEARRIGLRSDGAFDVTVGPLVNALGFGPADGDGVRNLDPAMLDALRDRIGWDKLSLGEGTLSKTHPALYVDLGAIAKGYAVDRVAEALADAGHRRFMVEVGGEVRAQGTNAEGEPWRIGVERPQEEQAGIVEVVPLRDRAMATSGDYRNYREVDGRRISHIIDPRTARSIAHNLASTTVVAERCATADAWATALMVLGPEEGMKVAREEKLAVLMLVREEAGFRHIRSPAFDALLDE